MGGGHQAVCGRRSRPASAGPDPARAQVRGSTSDASCAGAAAASRGHSPAARGGGLPRPPGRSVWARTPGGLARPSCGSDSREASGRARPPLTVRAGGTEPPRALPQGPRAGQPRCRRPVTVRQTCWGTRGSSWRVAPDAAGPGPSCRRGSACGIPGAAARSSARKLLPRERRGEQSAPKGPGPQLGPGPSRVGRGAPRPGAPGLGTRPQQQLPRQHLCTPPCVHLGSPRRCRGVPAQAGRGSGAVIASAGARPAWALVLILNCPPDSELIQESSKNK